MYTRVTQLEVDTVRQSVDDALALFREQVAPTLGEQEGYQGAYVFMTEEGKALLITFWSTPEAAGHTPFYAQQLAQHVTLFRAPPGRESYEVVYADVPVAV